MSNQQSFTGRCTNGLFGFRNVSAAVTVLWNGLLIFHDIFHSTFTLSSLVDIHEIVSQNLSALIGGPWLLLGVLLVVCAPGLLYRARLAWVVSVVLLLTTLAFTLNFYPAAEANVATIVFSLFLLVAFQSEFKHKSATAGGIFAITSFIVLLLYSCYGSLYLGNGFNPLIEDLPDAFYFSIVTMTTVGFGDIVPVSEAARFFTISIIVAGITIFATSLTTIMGPVMHEGLARLVRNKEKHVVRIDHFIICGLSAMASGMILQLNRRGVPLTLITSRSSKEMEQLAQQVGHDLLDVVIGDATDDDILTKASIQTCRAILALSEDDALNAFVILTAKELNKEVKTVLVVNDARNIHKVRQVKADVVLSPQLFGSEILVSVLTGENLNQDRLIAMLQSSGHGLFGSHPTPSEMTTDEDIEKE